MSLFERNLQRDIAEQAAAVVRRKEKEDKDKGDQLRQDALQTLKSKTSRQDEDGPPPEERTKLVFKRYGDRSRR